MTIPPRYIIPSITLIAGIVMLVGAGVYVHGREKVDADNASAVKSAQAASDAEAARIADLEAKLDALSATASSRAEKKVADASATPATAQAIADLQKQLLALKAQRKTAPATPAPLPPPAPTVATQTPATTGLSSTAIAAKAKPSVVAITSRDGKATGFIIDKSGLIVTNAHVVGAAFGVTVTFSDKTTTEGYVTAIDRGNDVAILRVYGSSYTPLSFGSSDESTLPQGSSLYVFGYPFGLEGEVSFKDGTLSRILTYKDKQYLEMSNTIHPGNSGGPVLNQNGDVVGMSTMVVGYQSSDGTSVGETIKLAIPSSRLEDELATLKKNEFTYASSIRPQIDIYEAFYTKFNDIEGTIVSASQKYIAGFSNHDVKSIDDAVVLYDQASGAAQNLLSTYPKNFPFSDKYPLLIKQLSRSASDMSDTKSLAEEVAAAGVTDQATYSKYTDLMNRINGTEQVESDLSNQLDNIDTQARTYFLQLAQ